MATNPMQRKARNSILLGIVIGLLIGAAICALLYMQLTKLQQQIKEENDATRTAYVLTSDVKSGELINLSILKEVKVSKDVIPTDYITAADIGENTISKLDMTKGTVVSKAQIETPENKVTDDVRLQE